jgi:hypothetical protein
MPMVRGLDVVHNRRGRGAKRTEFGSWIGDTNIGALSRLRKSLLNFYLPAFFRENKSFLKILIER